MEDLSLDHLELAQAGDLDAYRMLVRTYERSVHSTVYRLVGSRFSADIEDITQDIFVKVYRALPQFDPGRGTKLQSWIFTFVKNYCFDVLKRKRLRTVPLETQGENGHNLPVPSSLPGPSEQLASRETQEAIAKAVDLLPREQRLAFVLREYEGLPYADIASITECSEGTVKSRIHRAKDALRFRLRGLVLDTEGGVH